MPADNARSIDPDTGCLPAASASVPSNLDPVDWDQFRRDAHGALDDMIDHIATVRDCG
jgi:aromatic-L-amino-acid decarboxylase